jgi:menaquinone-9 beta-reductase
MSRLNEHDIVIVGGGPAGSTTALAVAQAAPELAPRVLLLEKARYPRDKPCAGALAARGDWLLRSLGVDIDVPSVRIDGVSFRGANGEAAAAPGGIGRVVRRIEFDHALARAAASRGVVVRDGVRVTGVRADGRSGAIVDTSEGPLRARAVVGCDGIGSVVRRALGLGPGELRAQVIEVDTAPVRGDRDRGLIHFDASDRGLTGYAWDFPTIAGGRKLVSRGVYQLRKGSPATAGADVGALLERRLHALGIDAARYDRKRYAERGYEPAARVARGAMMLVGESSGIDPATGEGIAQAIEYGVLAGRFLAERVRMGAEAVALDGWVEELGRSRLGRDLRVRTRLVRLFHGGSRSRLERLVTDSPDFLYVGCQYFGAQPYDWLRVGKVGLRAGTMLLELARAAV